MEWLFSWEVVSVVVGLLVSIGLGVLALDDFKLAKLCFLFAAADGIGGIAMWGAKSTLSPWVSTVTVICISGVIGLLALQSFRYVDRKTEQKERSEKPTDSVKTQHPVPLGYTVVGHATIASPKDG